MVDEPLEIRENSEYESAKLTTALYTARGFATGIATVVFFFVINYVIGSGNSGADLLGGTIAAPFVTATFVGLSTFGGRKLGQYVQRKQIEKISRKQYEQGPRFSRSTVDSHEQENEQKDEQENKQENEYDLSHSVKNNYGQSHDFTAKQFQTNQSNTSTPNTSPKAVRMHRTLFTKEDEQKNQTK